MIFKRSGNLAEFLLSFFVQKRSRNFCPGDSSFPTSVKLTVLLSYIVSLKTIQLKLWKYQRCVLGPKGSFLPDVCLSPWSSVTPNRKAQGSYWNGKTGSKLHVLTSARSQKHVKLSEYRGQKWNKNTFYLYITKWIYLSEQLLTVSKRTKQPPCN